MNIGAQLEALREAGLYRSTQLISGPQGPRVMIDGRPVLLLCSNNYLGFADHPRVRQAAADAAMRWGVGAGASRLVSGTMTIHEQLEQRLAQFEGTESCVLFGSGYLANVGVLSALGRDGHTIFSDALNHASIIDGCRLARADTFVYRHCDVDHLESALRERGREGDVIVTDTVFSMDGDVAPLAEIVALARTYGALVVVDEAHATGALGPGGRGAAAAAGLGGEVDVIVGSLSKALGSYGGYVCARREIVELMLNSARALIFSTAPPPPAVAGALAALELLIEQPLRPEKLQAQAMVLRDELAIADMRPPPGATQIIPLIVGAADDAVRMSAAALARGVFAQAIRPPTVPQGSARLRLTVMASHTSSELAGAAASLRAAADEVGVRLGVGVDSTEPVARAA
ncbi:MAG TPA: 8-amino-7-oxononanoate synthase [Solirubrobacteraceae bacterium]|nr:8-amino-7-oxononanoate synthase [Solirubrobacteraceae bacterium]